MTFFAQLVAEHSELYTYGPMGVILAWFLWRGEKLGASVAKRLDTLSHRIDGITRAMLVDVISRDSAGSHAKDAARTMLAKIEARDEGSG